MFINDQKRAFVNGRNAPGALSARGAAHERKPMEMQPGCEPPARLEWPLPQVARITLCRGAGLNTLTFEMIEGLNAAIGAAAAGSARVVIVTGEGKAFCGGAHVKYFADPASDLGQDPERIRNDYVKAVVATFRKLQDGPFATIAAINGFALGGGFELALFCDFRLMAAAARIGLTEARLGAVPGGGGLQLLSKIVGRARALEVILLAEQWSAERALAAGLITAVHDADELSESALALAQRLLMCSPIAIATAKAAIGACELASADVADEIALDAVRHVAGGPDWREGMTAFSERRPPCFAVQTDEVRS